MHRGYLAVIAVFASLHGLSITQVITARLGFWHLL
jgi:hypothetical protein